MTLEDIARLQKGTEEKIEGWRGEEQRKEGFDLEQHELWQSHTDVELTEVESSSRNLFSRG